MIKCQNCGQVSADGSNFCRFCGRKFAHFPVGQPPRQQLQQPQQFPPAQRRPYSWKTDELQQKKQMSARDTRQIDRVRPIAGLQNSTTPIYQQPLPNQALQTHQNPRDVTSHGYRCPRCQTPNLPIVKKRISAAGWVTFALLLMFTFVFFWIGLLMKEEVRVCPVCDLQVA